MKKTFRLEELDCANCATKMEAAVSAIPGVTKATISFMAQKMVLDADDARFNEILDAAEKAIQKVDSHCRIER